MKKYIIFAFAAVAALAACSKGAEAPADEAPSQPLNQPAWVLDESLPVPVEFGLGNIVATKGIALTNEAFATAEFGILAVNQAPSEQLLGTIMSGFEGGVWVQNQTTNIGTNENPNNILTANFGQSPKYYPYMAADGWFNFYGYRVNGTQAAHTLTEKVIEGVAIGQNDIIWAEAAPAAANLTAIGYDHGFNAKYIRAARTAAGENKATYYGYLPHLDFEHLTSQIVFNVKAADATAETTLSGVLINSITLGGTNTNYPNVTAVASSADFDVVEGTLTAVQDAEDPINVANINTSGNFSIVEAGAPCGEPIFILPKSGKSLLTITFTLPGTPANTQTIYAEISAPAIVGTGTAQAPQYPADTYVKGYSYQYTVILQSIEKIEIVTSLADWITVPNAGEITIE